MIEKVKRLSPTNPVSAWIFVSALSAAPVLVAAIQIQLTDWPAIDPLLGHFVSLSASKYSIDPFCNPAGRCRIFGYVHPLDGGVSYTTCIG